MNKLTLVSMAILCLLFSCSDLEQEPRTATELISLQSRSSSNNISFRYLSTQGQSLTKECTRAELSYLSQSSTDILLVLEDGTAYADTGSNIKVTVAEGYELTVTADQNEITVMDLNVTICIPELCYTNTEGSIAGTALEFIIEDDSMGF